MGVFYLNRMTCRHFRYQVPREYADELRDADPEPCPVCDVLPHRKALAAKRKIAAAEVVTQVGPQRVVQPGWLARLLGKREEILPVLPTPVRASV